MNPQHGSLADGSLFTGAGRCAPATDRTFTGAPVGSPTTPSPGAATDVVTDTYSIKGIPANVTGS